MSDIRIEDLKVAIRREEKENADLRDYLLDIYNDYDEDEVRHECSLAVYRAWKKGQQIYQEMRL